MSSFMILNLIVAMFAFSFLIGVVSGQANPFESTPDTQVEGTTPDSEEVDTNIDSKPDDVTINPGGLNVDSGKDGTVRDDGTGGGNVVDSNTKSGINNIFKGIAWQSVIQKGAIGAGIFGTIGGLAGGKDGALWGALAGGIGGAVAGLLEKRFGQGKSILIGLGVAAAIFVLTYKKPSEEIVEFHCLPWQAPVGGEDCQICNNFEHCSEYMCKSLGQACDIINPGTEEQKCVWVNPHDVNSPIIKMTEVSKDYKFVPDNTIRPPATGVVISQINGGCVRAFFPLEFSFVTKDSGSGIGEPSQCKIDYNLTKDFENMAFFVGGDDLFKNNHTEKLSLPGPAALNAVSPELKNDGEYTLFVRCQDANGNFNQDAYSVSFCVEKGPDTTPPLIVDTNVPTGNPVKFNQTNFDLEVYVNEPSECKWSREDRDYDNMENDMECANNLWEMNNQQVYVCKTTLTGVSDRKDNDYFFKCKDQPWASEGDRNVNRQSYKYTLVGTQPLNILDLGPTGTIFGATDTIPVFLEITTDNGHQNGESLCYYYNDKDNSEPDREEDYVLFHKTKDNKHSQRQDLIQGDYVYYVKCVDLGGNAEYSKIEFGVETDRNAPIVVRAYREGDLKIITDENAECSYSTKDCNFEVDSGVEMESINFEVHTADWNINTNYYIRCKDKYDNQPNPNTCSIIARPSLSEVGESDGGFDFVF